MSAERQIFTTARGIEDMAERAAYLEQACAGDANLRRQVERLLAIDEEHQTLTFLKDHSDDDQTQLVGTTIGRYRLLEEIGEGGCGIVFMAEQREPVRRRVALKVIKPGMDTREVVARFEAERQAIAMMDHPNIARIFDGGTTDSGRPYFVMELVNGPSITEFCDDCRMSAHERLKLFADVCHAVHHAHQKGIIHRDIKPTNVLVTLHDGTPVPKIIDFGIAKAISQTLTEKTLFTRFGRVVGTPQYMSPEQAERSSTDVDTRSDVYSLGVLLYELLTGTTPLEGDILRTAGYEEILRKIRTEDPPTPSSRLSTLGEKLAEVASSRSTDWQRLSKITRGELDWIAMRALEKDRARRYSSAQAFGDDVRKYLAGLPIDAGPPSGLYRLRKTIRRHRLWVTVASIFALSLAAAVFGLLWSWLSVRNLNRQLVSNNDELRVSRRAESHAKSEAIQVAREARAQAYASDMNLAFQSANLGTYNELLNRYIPKAGQRDLRGWEWRFLWQLMHDNSSHSMPPHDCYIMSVELSRDGRILAVGDFNGVIELYDTVDWSRTAVATLPNRVINEIVFSADGQLVTADSLGFVTFWSLSGLEKEHEVKSPATIVSLAISSNDQMATFSWDSVVRLWEMSTGHELARFDAISDQSAYKGKVEFNPNNQHLLIGDATGRLRAVDLQTEQVIWTVGAGNEGITALALSPNGSIAATGTGYRSQEIRLWNTASGVEVGELHGHESWVSDLHFSSDQHLVSTSGDATVRIWDTSNPGEPPAVLRGHRRGIHAASVSGDGNTIVTGGKDGVVKTWQPQLDDRHIYQFLSPAQLSDGCRAAISHDSKNLAVIDGKGQVRVFDSDSLAVESGVPELGMHNHDLIFSADDSKLVVADRAGSIRVWDRARSRIVETVRFNDTRAKPISLTTNGRMVTGHWSEPNVFDDHHAVEWQLGEPNPISTFSVPVAASVALAPDASIIAIGHSIVSESGITLWQRDGTRLFSLPRQSATVDDVAFSPDGSMLASASDPTVVWDVSSRSPRLTIPEASYSVAFSPDSKRILVGGRNIQLWSILTGRHLLTLSPPGNTFDVSFSTDGNLLIAAARNGYLHVWQAPSFDEIKSSNQN